MLSRLETTRDFRLVAGEGGLDKTIDCTEILDFEFDDAASGYRRERLFDGNSLVLTSFLYAKDRPELIADSVKRLISYDVHALAYKPVIFKELPREAVELADAMNFPIFVFGKDCYMENIILEIRNVVLRDRDESIKSLLIETVIGGSDEENEIVCSMVDERARFISAICLSVEDPHAVRESVRFAAAGPYVKRRVFPGVYGHYLIMLMAQEEPGREHFEKMCAETAAFYGIDAEKLAVANKGWSAISEDRSKGTELIRQAYWACRVGEIENKKVITSRDMGIYGLLTHYAGDEAAAVFADRYLAPITEEEGRGGELMQTAIAYVRAGGDTAATAEKLFCHKNTIRYRINKIQEKLDPKATEGEFFVNLSVAVKIHLLNEKL